MAWPTENLETTALDSGGDDPSAARSWIKKALDQINDIRASRGAANGIASLGNDNKVPGTQLGRGSASGVASLNSNSRIPVIQLPAATTSEQGAAKLSTVANGITGTATDEIVTPEILNAAINDKLDNYTFAYLHAHQTSGTINEFFKAAELTTNDNSVFYVPSDDTTDTRITVLKAGLYLFSIQHNDLPGGSTTTNPYLFVYDSSDNMRTRVAHWRFGTYGNAAAWVYGYHITGMALMEANDYLRFRVLQPSSIELFGVRFPI